MIRLALLTLFALGLAMPASAQTDVQQVETIVRSVYAGFGGDAPAPDILRTARLQAADAECTRVQDAINAKEGDDSTFGECGEDYDVFCQCQDTGGTDWSKIKVAVTPGNATASAVLTFAGGKPDLKLVFRRIPAGWALDDFWEYRRIAEKDDPSYRSRLVKSIQAMRAKLGEPAWQEPAL
jgi:hypothetical protein